MRFAAKVLTGLPSILAGVFAFAVVVVMTGEFSAPAGGVALALLMLPTVLLTAEEAIKRSRRECAKPQSDGRHADTGRDKSIVADGRARMLTGVMLAVARAAGETAPLLFTSLFSNYWMSRSTAVFPAASI